MFIIYIKGK